MSARPPAARAAVSSVARVEGLTVTFRRNQREIRALRGVSFDIGSSEILGIVGESGSGKTVIGLSLLGLLATRPPGPRVTGHVVIHGVDMVEASVEQQRQLRLRHLGAVFQDPMTSLNPTMRVGRQVEEATGSFAGAVRLLDAVGIPEPASRARAFPHELSGGLRQRVMLAIALAGSPSLIVADEPTTALDVTLQAQILTLLRQLRNEFACSFLFITHDLGVAGQIADRIAVLYSGRLAEIGTTTQILANPAHPYTAGLLASRLTMHTALRLPIASLSGEPPDPGNPPPGCPFAPRCEFRIPNCESALPDLRASGPENGAVACIRSGEVANLPHRANVIESAPPEPAVQEACLRLESISKFFRLPGTGWWGYRRALVLRRVSLEVGHGESVALVGESGCGKSTLLRIVAGLIRPDNGTVTLSGDERPQLVFQDAGSSLTPWLSVGEQIRERLLSDSSLSRHARNEEVLRTLREMRLSAEIARSKPGELSGGQRQRVAIARAMIVPPPLLLCDEPTSALDVSLAASVLNLLMELRRKFRTAFLFVTHDLAVARMVANRIAVMYLGEIVEVGPAHEVTTSPAHPYTAILLSSLPAAGAKPIAMRGEMGSAVRRPVGCTFHPRCPAASDRCRREPPPFERHVAQRFAACWHPFSLTEQAQAPARPGSAE